MGRSQQRSRDVDGQASEAGEDGSTEVFGHADRLAGPLPVSWGEGRKEADGTLA